MNISVVIKPGINFLNVMRELLSEMSSILKSAGVLPKKKKMRRIVLPRASDTRKIANAITKLFNGSNFPGVTSGEARSKKIGRVNYIIFNETNYSLRFFCKTYTHVVFYVSPKTFRFLRNAYDSAKNKEERKKYSGTFMLDLSIYRAEFGSGF